MQYYVLPGPESLHSTMFLLIQDPVDGDIWVMIVFTFHYVSINTPTLPTLPSD